MRRQITEKSFFQFLKCPTWVYFDAHAPTPRPHHPLLSALLDDGLIEAKQRTLLDGREDMAEVTAEDSEEAFLQTLAFMREGRQTIYRAVLMDKHYLAHPDVLEKVQGESKLGKWYYVAADIKSARAVRDEYAFQGCFYAELLETIQGVRPKQGYVVTPDNEVLSYAIEKYEQEYHLTLHEIEEIVAGRRPPHFVTSGCKNSPWFSECRGLSESCDDISLLNRVWREEVARLQQAGITTVSQLAKLSVHEIERRAPDLDPGRLSMLQIQAIALTEGRHILLNRAHLPEARVELFFDVESDPLRDFDYLLGVLAVSEGKQKYHAFLARTPEEQKDMWQSFLSFIESYHDAPVYHYGGFEQEVVRRLGERHGRTPIAQEALERNMIDILFSLRHSVVFPLPFYSLKDIGAYLGFHWRSEDAGGANSVLWFEDWLKTKDEGVLKKIVEYNEDDVRATHHLQRWLRENAT